MQVTTRELEASVARVDHGSRHGPHDRLSRAVPANQDRAGRCGVPEPVRVHAERVPGIAVPRPRASKVAVKAGSQVLSDTQRAAFVGQPPEREDRDVPRRDEIGVITRPPQMHERRVLPGRRLGPLDTSMDGEERSARHAVLQARPRREPERAPSAWEPLVESADVPPEREDLRTRDAEPGSCQATPPRSREPNLARLSEGKEVPTLGMRSGFSAAPLIIMRIDLRSPDVAARQSAG